MDSCDSNVPFFYIDLTGSPDSSWSSPNISRKGQCCGADNNENCISFELLLDSGTAGIQIDMIGADPQGSLFYDIDCQGNYPGGSLKCISGAGPHRITFCKPGSNKNIYIITSIPKPIFPLTDTVRIGCVKKLEVLGIEDTSIVWNSIFPGNPGDYNNYLNCVDCVSPDYEPTPGAPAFVEYEVCGFPIADECGYTLTVCDTIRVYNFDALNASASPNPASYCDNGAGSGVTLTGTGAGGDGNYSFFWYNDDDSLVGSSSTYFAQAQGNYTVEVADGLNSARCPSEFFSISVIEGEIPLVDAGVDQKICATSPTTILGGSITFATGGVWSGGAGNFQPDSASLNATYIPTAAEIGSGQVELVLTSFGAGGGCPETNDTIIVTIPDSLRAVMIDTMVPCNGGTMGIMPTIVGGTAPFEYAWSTGANTNSISVNEGFYQVTVSDSLDCEYIESVSITAPSAVVVVLSSTDATTNGGADGTASASPSGGSPGYTYLWSPSGQTTATATGLSYGVHTVAVTDTNGCTVIASVVVNEPRCASFASTITNTDLICYEADDATAEVLVTGGTTPYSYSWSNGDTTAIVDSLAEGTYTVTITDSNGCIDVQTISVTQPTQITNVMSHLDATIISGNNGSATANPFGGSPGYTFLWSTGDTSATADSLFAGVYSVNIIDDSGCVFVDSVLINEPPCNDFIININKTDVSCGGLNDGEANVVIANGQSPFTITWSDGQDGAVADSLFAGGYSVTVSDVNNCTTFGNVTIVEPNPLSLSLSPTDISCFGLNDGTIDATVSGGVFPYFYSWSNGKSAQDQAYLSDTTFTLTVTDANGCIISGSSAINEPALLEASYTVADVTCNGGLDGFIDFIPTGGILPYDYLWSNSQTTEDLDSLTAGGYSVLLTDANNCAINTPIYIGVTEPDSIQLDSFVIDCPTPGSGVSLVHLTPSGGSFDPFQISYDNGVTFQSAGTYSFSLPLDSAYSIIIKDTNDCVSHLPDSIELNSQVLIDSIHFDNCYPNGSSLTGVELYMTGGEPGLYTISSDNGTTFSSPGVYTENLSFNNDYIFVAMDSLGCLSTPDTISLPDTLHIDAFISTSYNGQDLSCYGSTDATINTSTTGGVTNYSYLWSTSEVTDSITSVGAGSYTVIVTDMNSCKDTATVIITQPDSIDVSANVISNYNGENISCYGYNDGIAVANPTGGTGSITQLWSNASTNDTLFNVTAGTYQVIVTDVNGCQDSTTVTLTQPDSIGLVASVLSNFNGEDVSCNGSTDGIANVLATNGTGTYTYNWSNSTSNDTLLNVGAGVYSVAVTDINGCIDSALVTISEPDSLSLGLAITSDYSGQDIRCNGEQNGAISSTLSGGTAGFSYVWSSGQTSINVDSIGAGTYNLTVTDTNGCSISETVTLSQPDTLVALTSIISDYNGQNISCYDSLDGYAYVTVTGGTMNYVYQWSNADLDDTLNAVGAGNYSVIVTDTNGCLDTAFITITQPDSMITTEVLTNVSCNGGNDGAVDLTVTGGIPSYSYLWNGPAGFTATTQDIQSIAAGNYFVTITDSNGCVKSDLNIIVDPSAIGLDFDLTDVGCYGDSTGNYDLIVSGGTPGYIYNWVSDNGFVFNDPSIQDQTGLPSGTYTVTVTDSNNCYTTLAGVINEPPILFLMSEYQNVSCYGVNDAYINVEVIGGAMPYVYNWSTGHTGLTLDSIGVGEYTFNLTDSNMCPIGEKFIITQPDSLTATVSSPTYFSGHHVTFFGEEDGSIDLTVEGGTLEYDFDWSNGEITEDLNHVGAGEYMVIVTDNQGCEVEATIVLTEPYDLAMPTGYSPNDDGANDFFVVRGIEAYPDNVITIFNRWGNVVYEKQNYHNEWDGLNMNGERLPDATYFVILKINNRDIELTGYVDMRR